MEFTVQLWLPFALLRYQWAGIQSSYGVAWFSMLLSKTEWFNNDGDDDNIWMTCHLPRAHFTYTYPTRTTSFSRKGEPSQSEWGIYLRPQHKHTAKPGWNSCFHKACCFRPVWGARCRLRFLFLRMGYKDNGIIVRMKRINISKRAWNLVEGYQYVTSCYKENLQIVFQTHVGVFYAKAGLGSLH